MIPRRQRAGVHPGSDFVPCGTHGEQLSSSQGLLCRAASSDVCASPIAVQKFEQPAIQRLAGKTRDVTSGATWKKRRLSSTWEQRIAFPVDIGLVTFLVTSRAGAKFESVGLFSACYSQEFINTMLLFSCVSTDFSSEI